MTTGKSGHPAKSRRLVCKVSDDHVVYLAGGKRHGWELRHHEDGCDGALSMQAIK